MPSFRRLQRLHREGIGLRALLDLAKTGCELANPLAAKRYTVPVIPASFGVGKKRGSPEQYIVLPPKDSRVRNRFLRGLRALEDQFLLGVNVGDAEMRAFICKTGGRLNAWLREA